MAKPRNFVPVSPSVQQRAHMRSPEYIPLILEPQSRLYLDPLIVLDFQSLYPSIMIAYNYCFSTCLGRVEELGQLVFFSLVYFQIHLRYNGIICLTSFFCLDPIHSNLVHLILKYPAIYLKNSSKRILSQYLHVGWSLLRKVYVKEQYREWLKKFWILE